MGLTEKIKEIEEEMARTQKNKATEYHLGLLKAKLAKYRSMLIEGEKKAGAGGKGEGFDVEKHGDARIAMIGFPSVGKSSILSHLTETESLAANYEFTTLTCIPGVLRINEAKMQLLDLPGIIEGAASGKGRGRQVIAVGKSSDLIMMVLDAQKGEEQKEKITRELESVGIRLNKEKPQIHIKVMKTGGIIFNATVKLTKIDEKMVRNVLAEYKIHNAHVSFRDDHDVDELIDVIESNRKYVKCIYVYNKIDTVSIEDVDKLMQDPYNAAISVHMNLGCDILLEKIWDTLGLVRVYTRKKGQAPDFQDPLILTQGRDGITVKSAIMQIHKGLLKDLNYAYIWGKSVKHSP
jgi:uncharacterized protein